MSPRKSSSRRREQRRIPDEKSPGWRSYGQCKQIAKTVCTKKGHVFKCLLVETNKNEVSKDKNFADDDDRNKGIRAGALIVRERTHNGKSKGGSSKSLEHWSMPGRKHSKKYLFKSQRPQFFDSKAGMKAYPFISIDSSIPDERRKIIAKFIMRAKEGETLSKHFRNKGLDLGWAKNKSPNDASAHDSDGGDSESDVSSDEEATDDEEDNDDDSCDTVPVGSKQSWDAASIDQKSKKWPAGKRGQKMKVIEKVTVDSETGSVSELAAIWAAIKQTLQKKAEKHLDLLMRVDLMKGYHDLQKNHGYTDKEIIAGCPEMKNVIRKLKVARKKKKKTLLKASGSHK